MPIMTYTTDITVEKTMGEVIASLSRRGVTRISTVLADGQPAGIAFTMNTDYGFREFELPIKVEGVLRAMTADRKVPRSRCTHAQAARVAWRIAKVWLEAQSALIDAELATLDEVMMPWMLAGKNGETVYSMIRTRGLKELEQ